MLTHEEIAAILDKFNLHFTSVTAQHDTSRGENDIRLTYILDNQYVLKVNSSNVMSETRLQEIQRLICRYCSIGIYCPKLIPASDGALSCRIHKDSIDCLCFVEEYAKYPVYNSNIIYDRCEIIEHLGILAARFSDTDLTDTKSMWSIIDLAPLDVDVDEKQENCDTLVQVLSSNGYRALANRVDAFNMLLRGEIQRVFRELPRCVFQGDLNTSNLLHHEGRFAGLIDFNMSGTDVNINVFLNEANTFPDEKVFDRLSVSELVEAMDVEQEKNLGAILKHYTMNVLEQYAVPRYRGIINLFQYPNVCAMSKWISEDLRREKCIAFIHALLDQREKSLCN